LAGRELDLGCWEYDGKIMRSLAGYLLIGCFAALGTSAIAMTGFDFALFAGPATKPGTVIQYVDRAHKGDRLALPTRYGARPVPRDGQAVPVGCDRVFSALSPERKNPVGRCLT
jgi:hypothetical protein